MDIYWSAGETHEQRITLQCDKDNDEDMQTSVFFFVNLLNLALKHWQRVGEGLLITRLNLKG
jgi:hypothetical protein